MLALGKGAGSCCQQRLRGRLKSRSLYSSCRQRISGAGTAGVPAGGHGGAGGTPGLAWLPAADKTAPVPACKASPRGPKQQPSWGKAAEQPRGGRHLRKGSGAVGARSSVHLLPAVPGRHVLAVGSIRRQEGGLLRTHPALKRLPGLWGEACSVPTAAAENPSPEGMCFFEHPSARLEAR